MIGSTRREVLAALLGSQALAVLGTQGCDRRRIPSGELAGADVSLGHALRSEVPSLDANAPVEHVQVAIVGAGVAGLSAGWRLASDERLSFALFELESVEGGTSRSASNPVTAYPWGAHYVPVPLRDNRALIRLLKEMDVLDGSRTTAQGHPIGREDHLVTEPEERVFYRGEWHRGLLPKAAMNAADQAQLRSFEAEIDRWVAWRDDGGRRAFALPIATASDDPRVTRLDEMSMAEWLDRLGIVSPRVRWYVDYACRDDYGCRLDTTSAWAGLLYFAARTPYPGAPSSPFLSWPEGNGRIVQHLRRAIGDRIRLGNLVVDIDPRDDAVALRVVDGVTHKVRSVVASSVIVATPQFLHRRLIRPWRDRPPPAHTAFETAPWLVANLTLRGRPANVGFVPAWDSVLYDSPSLGYVTATHQRGRRFGPTVLTYYYALTDPDLRRARQTLLSASREEWVDAILIDLERAHPDLRTLVDRVDLMRWGHAMVCPRPGFVWSEARRRAARPAFDRIHFAHTDLSAVPLLEEAQFHGVRAAEEVLSRHFGAPPSWLA